MQLFRDGCQKMKNERKEMMAAEMKKKTEMCEYSGRRAGRVAQRPV